MLYRVFDRFKQACEELYARSGSKTRTCIRWRADVGLLVMRLTDDVQTLTFKTRSKSFLNRFDSLNGTLLRKYHNRGRLLAAAQLDAPGPSEHTIPDPSASLSAGDGPKGEVDGAILRSKRKKGKKKQGK
ncbi:hypothetical protein JCM10296v2_007033 [Rhodotorula toruloides]